MKLKLVGFSAGTRHGNSEMYLKTALMAAKQMGIEVELIRLCDCDLRACKACRGGPCYTKGPGACILKDDGEWLSEKFLDSDGYILAAPVWSLSPCGVVTDFRDRVFGPKMDVAQWEMYGMPDWLKGRKKYRPGGLISVGGASSEHWTSLGMATLYTTTFSAQTNVVDNVNIYTADGPDGEPGEEYWMRRAKYLGQNVGHAMLNPQFDWSGKFLGVTREEEACPGCHLSLIIAKPGKKHVDCVVCGRKGYISLAEDGSISYKWPEDPQNRLTLMGKYDHMREIARNGEIAAKRDKEALAARDKYFRELDDLVVKPPKK